MSKTLVNQATSDNQQVPGGYLLKQLADKTFLSSSQSNDIESYLRGRLKKSSPDIKYKALLCIKYIAINGSDFFRANFQRDNNIIRDASHFRGEPDPLRGDKPNQKVRDAAKEAMAAIFATPKQRPVHNKMSGYGNTGEISTSPNISSTNNYSQGTYNVPKLESGAYSSGSMQGFGNPAFNNSPQSSFVDKLKNKFGRNDNNSKHPFKPYEHKSGYTGPRHHEPPPPAAEANVSVPRKRGQVGGGWGTSNVNNKNNIRHNNNRMNNNNNNNNNGRGTSNKNIRVSKASSGEFESRLVDSITQPSGVRTLPQSKELKEFISKAKHLDGVLLASILQTKFSDNDWRTQLKALAVVESLIKSHFDDVIAYFTEELNELVTFETSSIKQIAQKASSILIKLGIKEANVVNSPPSNTSHHSNNSAPLPDLLSEDSLQQNQDIKAESPNLFADMNINQSTPPMTTATITNDNPLASLFNDDDHQEKVVSSTNTKTTDPFGLFNDEKESQQLSNNNNNSGFDFMHNNNDNRPKSSYSNNNNNNNSNNNIDPLQSLLGNVNISSTPPLQSTSPKSSYEQFSSMPLTIDPAPGQLAYKNKNYKNQQMEFTVKQAPQGKTTTIVQKPNNVFDHITSSSSKSISPKKKDDGFQFISNDSFAFVQDEFK